MKKEKNNGKQQEDDNMKDCILCGRPVEKDWLLSSGQCATCYFLLSTGLSIKEVKEAYKKENK